ncbi:hypothetical protein PSENEW3_00002531 [Picochlorum sp. SENEW3]|nr:hypothetical protein PSENEW3_00002531 [Picochlorum sp. SENEW3]
MNVVVQTRLQSVVHRHHKAGTVGPALLAFRINTGLRSSGSQGGKRLLPSTVVQMSDSGDQPDARPQEEAEIPEAQQKKGLAKGQGTAIVTGVISIVFGLAYLALVQVMDMRGGELQPPPPEATERIGLFLGHQDMTFPVAKSYTVPSSFTSTAGPVLSS